MAQDMFQLYMIKDVEVTELLRGLPSAIAFDLEKYFKVVSAGASALPFMKASCSPTHMTPLVGLPPEMLERVYMYCTEGMLGIQVLRRLYPAGVLLGMEGMTDREIVHRAVIEGMLPVFQISGSDCVGREMEEARASSNAIHLADPSSYKLQLGARPHTYLFQE